MTGPITSMSPAPILFGLFCLGSIYCWLVRAEDSTKYTTAMWSQDSRGKSWCPYYDCIISQGKPKTIKEYVDMGLAYKVDKTEPHGDTNYIWVLLIAHILVTFAIIIPGLVYLFLSRDNNAPQGGLLQQQQTSPPDQQQNSFKISIQPPKGVSPKSSSQAAESSLSRNKGPSVRLPRLSINKGESEVGKPSPRMGAAQKDFLIQNKPSQDSNRTTPSPLHMSDVFGPLTDNNSPNATPLKH